MKNKDINSVLKKVWEQTTPSKEELNEIDRKLKKFLIELKKRIKKLKLNTGVFVGGSFAKKTMIKKKEYDVDIFLRFDKAYENAKLSGLTEQILKGIPKKKIHGSRDYFEVKVDKNLFFEIIPVRKVRNSKESENITDLSYSHVNYIRKKLKSKKILEDIKIAKAFCYANKFYGAESHIGGFSGYSLELLIYYYGSFVKFLKALHNEKNKVIIDIEKQFKNKREILMDLNAAKLSSPIVLVDPTYKHRNVLAALTNDTFNKLQREASNFLKNPNEIVFNEKKFNFEKISKEAKRKKLEFVLIKIGTKKQKGSIAGSKLKKFYGHLGKELEKYFEIKKRDFEYSNGKDAICFFVTKNKKEILIQGPEIPQKENVKKFKKAHKKTIVKSGRIYAKKKINFDTKEFLEAWSSKNKNKLKDMSIESFRILN